MVLLKDGSVLGKQSLLLFFDDGALAGLFLLFKLLLGSLGLSLGLVDCQLLLPEALDLALMLLFAHAASLSVHLLQSIVLCELLHQLALEILFHAFLFQEMSESLDHPVTDFVALLRDLKSEFVVHRLVDS